MANSDRRRRARRAGGDEPALKDMTVDGVPVKLQTATSKAEAIEAFTQSSGPPNAPYFAVALIDVVMETREAGLELCDFIRNNLKNKTTQLYIRTGQAGVAPERAVIDRYDVNGYFTKVETTEDKLYSVVKAAVRQNEYLVNSQVLLQIITRAAGQPRPVIERVLGSFGAFLHMNQVSIGIVADGAVLSAIGYDRAEVLPACQHMQQFPATTLSAEGDLAYYAERTAMFKSAAGDCLIFSNVSPPSPPLQLLQMSYLKVLAALAKAGVATPQASVAT